jgi:hypothetical protein
MDILPQSRTDNSPNGHESRKLFRSPADKDRPRGSLPGLLRFPFL